MEVSGMEGDAILLQPLFEFKRMGLDEDNKIRGKYQGHGYAPNFYRELEEGGASLDRNIFGDAPELEQYEKSADQMNELANRR